MNCLVKGSYNKDDTAKPFLFCHTVERADDVVVV